MSLFSERKLLELRLPSGKPGADGSKALCDYLGIAGSDDVLLMVAAIMAGSLMWWIGLSNLISRHRHKIDASRLGLINRVAGVLLAVFGVLLLAEVAWKGGQF